MEGGDACELHFPYKMKQICGENSFIGRSPMNEFSEYENFKKVFLKGMINLNVIPIIVTIGLILLDQGTKLWALSSLKPIHNTTVVEGFLDLTFVENRGVAFGMFSGQRWFILVLTGLIAGALVYFYRTLPKKAEYTPVRVSLLLVLSGAIGNIIDRVFRGYVVDFFEFTFFDWPVFNVADIYVVVGVILLTFLILFVVKDDDLSMKKKKDE